MTLTAILNPLESAIERAVVRYAFRRYGVTLLKINGPQQSGWPDRMVLWPFGRPTFIEFKRYGEKPTEKQAAIHRRLRALGYSVAVIDSAAAGRTHLDDLAAARLSKEGDAVRSREPRHRAVPRPRARKDLDHLRRIQSPQAAR